MCPKKMESDTRPVESMGTVTDNTSPGQTYGRRLARASTHALDVLMSSESGRCPQPNDRGCRVESPLELATVEAFGLNLRLKRFEGVCIMYGLESPR